VNGQPIIDKWVAQSPTTWNGLINLEAQQLYAIEMDYFQAGGGALSQLAWSSPSTTPGIVPQTQLYPSMTLPPTFQWLQNPLTSGSFQLQISTVAGQRYLFQAATDLVHWVTLSTNVAPSNLMFMVDPAISNFPARFYRAAQLP
jgi:hypothetical protein